MKVAALKPHPRNARKGNVNSIFQSIDKNGFYGAVIAQRSTGFVLAGNHRLKAAIEAGIDSLPVLWVDVDDKAARRILLADNRTNDLAGYAMTDLAQLLTEVKADEGSLDGTGYDSEAFDKLVKELGDARIAEAGGGAGESGSANEPVIQYNIIFATEAEQQAWFEFLRKLKGLYPEGTISGRIVRYIEDNAPAED